MTTSAWQPKEFENFEEFCDWTVQQLVEQGEQAFDGADDCCHYRMKSHNTGKAIHCAIGMHINPTDEAIEEICEVEELLHRYNLPHLKKWQMKDLRNLQAFHDASTKSRRTLFAEALYESFGKSEETAKPQYQAWCDLGEEL
jgi:hypothetical protein